MRALDGYNLEVRHLHSSNNFFFSKRIVNGPEMIPNIIVVRFNLLKKVKKTYFAAQFESIL